MGAGSAASGKIKWAVWVDVGAVMGDILVWQQLVVIWAWKECHSGNS